MNAWTDVVGWTLLHFVWEGTLIAVVAALALQALRRASAQLRYVIACGALLTALFAPVATAVSLVTVSDAARIAEPLAGTPVPLMGPVRGGSGLVTTARASLASLGPQPIIPTNVASILSLLVSAWAVGVLLLTIRLGLGWWRVHRLHADALASPASQWLATATQVAGTLGLSRAIHVVDSVAIDTPTVIGWLRPVILLPIAALANLTPGQVQAILAHELAHVQRHDFLVNLLQAVAETLLFYHPAVWWLSSRIRAEREHCCDDVAVAVCGDPVDYADALTTLASWACLRTVDAAARPAASLAVAATGGSLLLRIRRLLKLPADRERSRPRAPFVIGVTVLLIVLIGARLMVVAQVARDPDRQADTLGRPLGPPDINRILGFNLFPPRAHYATDDPAGARAWDVKVVQPDGEMSFIGFTGRSLIRYAYRLEDVPVVDGPSWVDGESQELHAETNTVNPTDADFREAIRLALEAQYGMSIRRESRLFPVYGLQPVAPGNLGPNIRRSTVDCVEDFRKRPDILGPSLHARGQVVLPFCGVDHTIHGPKGYRVTLAQFARSLRGFGMEPSNGNEPDREVIDQTGLMGVYDFELNLGFLPFAAIATAHPAIRIGFGPMIRTFPQAIEEQLGLKLVPLDAPRDVVVIATAQRAL
jgi:uncharacterized protein (TIGR03435 family)